MAGANVDIESVKKINAGLQKLQNVADKGLYSAERALTSIQNEVLAKYRQGQAKVGILEGEIAQLERRADATQAEYDRQQREAQEAKAQGRPYVCNYLQDPNDLRRNANAKKKQLEELKRELELLKKQMTEYKASREVFLTEFKKIASDVGGGDDGQLTRVLEKTIIVLDDYVHTNFSSENASSYDNYATQLREANQRSAESASTMQQEFIRTLND